MFALVGVRIRVEPLGEGSIGGRELDRVFDRVEVFGVLPRLLEAPDLGIELHTPLGEFFVQLLFDLVGMGASASVESRLLQREVAPKPQHLDFKLEPPQLQVPKPQVVLPLYVVTHGGKQNVTVSQQCSQFAFQQATLVLQLFELRIRPEHTAHTAMGFQITVPDGITTFFGMMTIPSRM